MVKVNLFFIGSLVVLLALGGAFQPVTLAQPIEAQTQAPSSLISVTRLDMTSSDLVYDPLRNKIYASVPSFASSNANSVVPINLPGGALGTPIEVGGDPNKLAIADDGSQLYVGLDGAAAVRQVNLVTKTAGLQFSLGSSFCGPFFAEDMVVLAGSPHSVAISRRNNGCSPRHEGVAIYDDGVQRPDATPGHTGSNVIEPSFSPDILYGYNNETTEFGLRVMQVITSGVVVSSTTGDLIERFNADIRYDNDRVYATTGAIIDPEALTLVGTFSSSGLVAPDSATGRVYFLHTELFDKTELFIYDQETLAPITHMIIPGVSGTPTSLINAGRNLLAFRTDADQVYILRLQENYYSTYLPVAIRPMAGISGRVTFNGNPASGQQVSLYSYDGSSSGWQAYAYTDAEGWFSFTDQPTLDPGIGYYVLYKNQYNEADKLWVWVTRLLTSYATGSDVTIGSFDIADIALNSPPDMSQVTIPATFTWTPRSQSPSDSYEFDLYEPYQNEPYFYTDPPLGYVGSYTLSGLPPGFSQNTYYAWEIWVYSPDGGYGISYDAWLVNFTGTGQIRKIVPVETAEKTRLPAYPLIGSLERGR